MDREFWSSFSHDPRDEQFQSMRASDQDRAAVAQALTEAYADGRLDREELDERTERVTRSRTLGELTPIVSDLVPSTTARAGRSLASASPADIHSQAVEKYRSDRREAVFGFLFATLVTTVIWLATTGAHSFPWPAFVALATGLNIVKTVSRKQDIIRGHERKLERKQAKELGKPWTPDDQAAE